MSPLLSVRKHSSNTSSTQKEEEELLHHLDRSRLPHHIAIIMDGNGRWAVSRHLPRVFGHRAGISSVRDIVRACAKIGVQVLTLYAFSSENWSRPNAEVQALMRILEEYLQRELPELQRNGVRLKAIGRIQDLPSGPAAQLKRTIDATSHNTGLTLNLALNYGGRQEIVDACNRIIQDKLKNVDEADFARYLYTAPNPDPDLLIRTSGEMRLSNFLLWQLAYTEIHITSVPWPEFRRIHLYKAIADFQTRERRFGGL